MELKTTVGEIKTVRPYYTPEEYLELEAKADRKHEYRDGEMIPMAGGTTNHNKIALNLATVLNLALDERSYEIYIQDVKLWLPRYRVFAYPDVMVVRDRPIYYEGTTTTVINPIFIAEVLSKSTQDYDRGDKFRYYRSIPEFQEYLLIDQTQYHLMQYVKTAESQWLLTEYESAEAEFTLRSLGVTLSLKQLYQRVNFDENIE